MKSKKKRFSPEMDPFFSPKSAGDLRSDAHQSQIIGGNADEDHNQIIGDSVKLFWGIYLPGFQHPCSQLQQSIKLLHNATS